MEALAQAESNDVSFWKNPSAWLRGQKLSRGYWIFFTAAFFYDFGFSIYTFLFNLYLLDRHFNERSIGLIGSAALLGSVVGMLPAGLLARKFGTRPLLLICFITAPLLGILRVLMMVQNVQLGLAFLDGISMCLWAVCFLPAVARTTTEDNRQSAFSLIVSVSIGSSMVGGIFCSYAQQWLRSAGFIMQSADVKRLILFASCCIAALGIFPVLRLHLPVPQDEPQAAVEKVARRWKLDPFLIRFLPAMALWTIVISSFSPFANIYLSKVLHMPFSQIGFVFSASQIVQLVIGLLTPLLFRALGIINGITATQLTAAIALGSLAGTHNLQAAVVLYLAFSALQWMTAPGMYNLLMGRVPDKERPTASSMMMFCNALTSSAATAGAGILFTKFGYPPVLAGIAVLAVVAALAIRFFVGPSGKVYPAQP